MSLRASRWSVAEALFRSATNFDILTEIVVTVTDIRMLSLERTSARSLSLTRRGTACLGTHNNQNLEHCPSIVELMARFSLADSVSRCSQVRPALFSWLKKVLNIRGSKDSSSNAIMSSTPSVSTACKGCWQHFDIIIRNITL